MANLSNTRVNHPIIQTMRPEGLPEKFGEPLPFKPVRETGRVFFAGAVGSFYTLVAILFKKCIFLQSSTKTPAYQNYATRRGSVYETLNSPARRFIEPGRFFAFFSTFVG